METKKAFTLIELLVVIAIIALLLSIVVPSLRKVKDRAKDIVCSNNEKQFGVAMQAYASQNKQFVPANEATGNWQLLMAPYIGGLSADLTQYWKMDVYQCPKYPDKTQIIDYTTNAWKYNAGSLTESQKSTPTNITRLRNPASIIYMSDYAYATTAAGAVQSWIHIVTEQLLQQAISSKNPALVTSHFEYMDIWAVRHLPVSTSEQRIAGDRHKETGQNNLFFDGSVRWLDSKENDAQKWRIRE